MENMNENEQQQFIQIKLLLRKARKEDKVNINIYKTDGKFTEKFKKFNRKMIREGKTFFYAPKDKFYNSKTGGFSAFKYLKKLRNGEKVLIKKQRDLKLNLSVNLNYFESKTVNTYKNQVITQLQTLNSTDKVSITINLNKINFKELIVLIRQYVPNTKLTSTTVNSNNVIMLSENNLNELSKINELTYQANGSDMDYLLNTIKSGGIITISNLGTPNFINENEGEFFKWYNTTNYDFSRYDIRNESNIELEYSKNCLLVALENGGLSSDKINKFKSITKNGIIPTCKLPKICNELDICIDVRKLTTGNDSHLSRQMVYGDKTKEKFKLGLIRNHYFILEKTCNTRYSLEHYDTIKDIKNCNEIKSIRANGKYNKDKTKFINSFDLVRILLEQEEKLLKPIPYDIICRTPYFEKDMTSDDLIEIDDSDLDSNSMVSSDNSDTYLIYFDFETITTGEKHQPYLVCAITQDGIKKCFRGVDCGRYFTNWLKSFDTDEIQLVAHNLKYDFSFIWEYIFCLNPIISGSRLLGGSGRLYGCKDIYTDIVFQDSYNLISCKLSDFTGMFQLESRKEFLPYSAYNETSVNELTKLETIFKSKEFKSQADKDLFYNNCIEWECIIVKNNKEYINLVEYSKKYCEIDCLVLKQGYEKFREQIKEVCDLDIKDYCTSASLANDFMIKEGVYDGCYKIAGIPRAFIQKCVYGGKVMTRRNEKFIIEKDTADYDCTSEYPSAMAEMEGVLKGKPKLLHEEHLNKEFLNSIDGYFVKVLCKNNSKKILDFPMLSYLDDNEIRQYTNNTKDKFYYLDKTMVEDAINFLGLEFDFICGYYYNEGRNPQIRKTIRHLFDTRVQKKKEKNPIQAVYKLLMNSAYGKSLLKPIDTDSKIINTGYKLEDYINKHYNFIKSITPLNSKTNQVKLIKPINKHFNNCYFGVEVLSMAKRIMSRVMITAEDMKIPMYYTDTDSIHIDYDGVEKLETEYLKRYGKVLKGKDLGQFHIDFELKGALSHTIKSKKSIYLGKKCYLDMLEGKDKDGNIVTGQHVRMKGIPNRCLEYYSNKLYNGSMWDMYKDLHDGVAVKFDLLCENTAIKFAYDGFDVKSLGYYKKDSEGNKVKCSYDDTEECNSEFARTVKF